MLEQHGRKKHHPRVFSGAQAVLGRGRPVGVAQHGVEGAGEVVGLGAAVVFLRGGDHASQEQKQQEKQLQR